MDATGAGADAGPATKHTSPESDEVHLMGREPAATDGNIETVKRANAIRHLVEMADVATDHLRLRDTDIGWPLAELWVTGELLGSADPIETGEVVLLLDVSADELPWLARHPAGEWVGERLLLGKRAVPLVVSALGVAGVEPGAPPPCQILDCCRRALHEAVIEALRSQRFDDLAIVEPSPAELAEQLGVELDAARRHLRSMVDQYWSDGWRREHKGYDESPEDHLWRAARAVSLLLDAVGDPGVSDGVGRHASDRGLGVKHRAAAGGDACAFLGRIRVRCRHDSSPDRRVTRFFPRWRSAMPHVRPDRRLVRQPAQ